MPLTLAFNSVQARLFRPKFNSIYAPEALLGAYFGPVTGWPKGLTWILQRVMMLNTICEISDTNKFPFFFLQIPAPEMDQTPAAPEIVAEVESFDKTTLKETETDVKQNLPTTEGNSKLA